MIIDLSQYVHVPEKSVYNHNYYKGKNDNTGVMLFVKCDEYYNTYYFYMVDGDNKIFIGSSQNFDASDIHHVSLSEMYTWHID